MTRWRLLFTLTALGLCAGPAAAHEPTLGVPGQMIYPHSQIARKPLTPPTEVGPSFYIPPNYPHLQNNPDAPRPIRTALQRVGVGCWSHFNQLGCGNLRSENAFIWGSCRTFFGQPCQHGPQEVPPGGPIPPPNVIPWGVLPGNPIVYAPPVVVH
jgi:hypothetical protein